MLKFGIRGQSAAQSQQDGKRFVWLGYATFNMGAGALAKADHPLQALRRILLYCRRLWEDEIDEGVQMTSQHAVLPSHTWTGTTLSGQRKEPRQPTTRADSHRDSLGCNLFSIFRDAS